MFPPRCSQPPCRNMETNIVMTFGSSAPGAFQKRTGTKATLISAGSRTREAWSRNSRQIETDHDPLGICAAKGDAACIRDAGSVRAIDDDVEFAKPMFERIAQCADIRSLARDLRGDAERHRQRHVLRSGAAAPFLRAAENVARERQTAPDEQRADALRRMQLMCGERQRVDTE